MSGTTPWSFHVLSRRCAGSFFPLRRRRQPRNEDAESKIAAMIFRRRQDTRQTCGPLPGWCLFLSLFLLTLAALMPGIWEATALTGKDEFFLGLRTPLEMIAGDHWLVPFLDGAPRIRKPPLLYWLGRASYEVFGVSLASARLVGVLFAALFVVASAGIARRLCLAANATPAAATRVAWGAGLVLLGCLGLHSEGRRFMLDVPVAALSAAAFWCFLIWQQEQRRRWLPLGALLLAAGFLVKGPIVVLLCGSGIVAAAATGACDKRLLGRHWASLLASLLLFAALALPWFAVVRQLYPQAAALVVADEIESRQFLDLSPHIFASLFNIGLPWAFVFAAVAWRWRRSGGLPRQLLLWFALSFLPFLLFKSFDRYLIGALLPFSIAIALALPELHQRWSFRLGALTALALATTLTAFAWRFHLGGWLWLLPSTAYLLWAWWCQRGAGHTLAAPALFALSVFWGAFPALGVNAVPAAVVELGKEREVAFYRGPQPAMLPILSARAHRQYPNLSAADARQLAANATPVFAEQSQVVFLQAELAAYGWRLQPLGEYAALASHGSGVRLAKPGATNADWLAAWNSRDLTPLKTVVQWFRVVPQ